MKAFQLSGKRLIPVDRVRCPFCGRRYNYAKRSEATQRVVDGEMITIMAYSCRACGSPFNDDMILPIVEEELRIEAIKAKDNLEIKMVRERLMHGTPEERVRAIKELLDRNGVRKNVDE